MPDPTPPTPPPLPTPPTPPPATPWHAGIDADILGSWQNKNYDLSDPIKVAIETSKANRKFEKHYGVHQPDRLITLPERLDDAAGWNAVHEKLGAPKDPKEYDFSTIKHADGNVPDAALLDMIRATAAALHTPKDAAPQLAAAVVKHLDGTKAEQAANAATTLAAEKAKLIQSWGNNAAFNRETASNGARRLGLNLDPNTGSPEDKAAVSEMEKAFGYARVMEMFRKIGAGTSEDTFVDGTRSDGQVATKEGAEARLNELMKDEDWGKRLTRGDVAADREYRSLMGWISGVHV